MAGNVMETHGHKGELKHWCVRPPLAPAGAVAKLVAGSMNHQTLITAAALIILRFGLPFASAAPKAYEIVNYKGNGPGITVVFEFANGYPGASRIKIIESGSGKTTEFYFPGEDEQTGAGKMRFAPVEGDDRTKEVLLQMEAEGDPPPTVKGTYTAGGKTVLFNLTKIEMDSQASAEFERADAELNKTYNALLARLPDAESKQKLQDSERAWIAFRDAEASFAADPMRGGTAAPVLRLTSMTESTEQRIKQLKSDYPP
jgi:uncharacterized protein YecT (DUF1311 family)